MRLSDAIALGLPEITFSWSQWLWFPENGNNFYGQPLKNRCLGCLAGAALWADGRRSDIHDGNHGTVLSEHWPWVKGWRFQGVLPCCGDTPIGDDIGAFLTHLAKHYANMEITAERVIEIVRSVEPEEAPSPTEALAESCSKSEVGA